MPSIASEGIQEMAVTDDSIRMRPSSLLVFSARRWPAVDAVVEVLRDLHGLVLRGRAGRAAVIDVVGEVAVREEDGVRVVGSLIGGPGRLDGLFRRKAPHAGGARDALDLELAHRERARLRARSQAVGVEEVS